MREYTRYTHIKYPDIFLSKSESCLNSILEQPKNVFDLNPIKNIQFKKDYRYPNLNRKIRYFRETRPLTYLIRNLFLELDLTDYF